MRPLKICIFWLLSISSSLSLADTETIFGVIDEYQVGSINIMVDDQLFGLAPNIKIKDQKGNAMPRTALLRGKKILYTVRWESPRPKLLAITFLSKDANRDQYENNEP